MIVTNCECNNYVDELLEQMLKEGTYDRKLEVIDNERLDAYLNYLSTSNNTVLLDNEQPLENGMVVTHTLKVYQDKNYDWHLNLLD